jgi:hypothetical protein
VNPFDSPASVTARANLLCARHRRHAHSFAAAARLRLAAALQNPRQRAKPRCSAGEAPVTDFSRSSIAVS